MECWSARLLLEAVSVSSHSERWAGLHSLPDHSYEVSAYGVEVGFVSRHCGGSLQRHRGVVLPTVEAAVDKALDTAPQRVEQSSNHKIGCYECQDRLP